MYYGGGSGWLWMGLLMIASWALVIFLAIWAIRSLKPGSTPQPPLSTPLNILEERFARGEISPEEFAKRRRILLGGS